MTDAQEYHRNLSLGAVRDDDRRDQYEVADMHQAKIDSLLRLLEQKEYALELRQKKIDALEYQVDRLERENAWLKKSEVR